MLKHIQALLKYIEPYSDIYRTLNNPRIYDHVIFTTLAHLEPKASSKTCPKRKMIRYILDPGILKTVCSRIFKDNWGYSGKLMQIQPHLQTRN